MIHGSIRTNGRPPIGSPTAPSSPPAAARSCWRSDPSFASRRSVTAAIRGVIEKDRDVAAEHKRLFEATIGRAAVVASGMSVHLWLTAGIIIGSSALESPGAEAAAAPDTTSRKRSRVAAE
jgi:hypothetical protein